MISDLMQAQTNQPNADELEKLLKDYQILQEQLRTTVMQLEQLQAQKAEMERAKEELDKASGKVYMNVGSVIVETDKQKALDDVNDRYSLADARIQTVNRQYTELKNKEKQLNEKITQIYKRGQGPA
jgi:prefoldin beta subunit